MTRDLELPRVNLKSGALQTILILVVWAGLCALHWENDGLWPSDAARHFSNGQFWRDFLLSFRLDARDYALSYYARYPVIKPTSYPPVFYLIEALMFSIFGTSSFVSKGIVQGFTLMAALYTAAWLRRWVTREAGWAAAILLFLPAIVALSHSVMLQIPSLAFSTATLYHGRRWLERDRSSRSAGQLWLCLCLGALAILTYYPSAVVMLVLAAWLLARTRFRSGRAALTAIATGIVVLLVGWVAIAKWAPPHIQWALPQAEVVFTTKAWTYYVFSFPALFGPLVLSLASVGSIGGLLTRRWRSETITLLIWVVVCYVVFSSLNVKGPRYILFITTPLVTLAVIGVYCLAAFSSDRLARVGARVAERPLGLTLLGASLICQVWIGSKDQVPTVQGFDEVVEYIEQLVPEGPVFYDGDHHGVFISKLQARDPDYKRRVVVGSKLLYAYANQIYYGLTTFADSPEDVVEQLRTRGGSRIVVIEEGPLSERIDTQKHIRTAVRGPEFELLASFQIARVSIERVDVYRLRGNVEPQEFVEIPFPILGKDVRYTLKPIER